MKNIDLLDKETGERIKQIRKNTGKNQDEFAILLEVDKQTLLRYEKGQRSPNSLFLKQLRNNIPDLNLHWLLTGDGDMFIQANSKNDLSTEDKETLANIKECPELKKLNKGYVIHKKKGKDALEGFINGLQINIEIKNPVYV